MTATVSLLRASLVGWVRGRGYLGTLGAGTGLILLSMLTNELSGAESFRVLIDMGLHFVALTSAFIASSATLMALTSREETLQLQVLATRPIPRSALILSRVFTGLVLVLVTALPLGLVLTVASFLTSAPHPFRVVPAVLFGCTEGFMVVAVAAALGSASSRALAGTLLAMSYMVMRIGPAAMDLRSRATPLLQYVPRLDRYSLSSWVHGESLADDLLLRAAYAVAFVVLLVSIAVVRFEKRDLQQR